MFSPSTRISPLTRTPSNGSSSRLSDLRSVVLPQPDGPTMTVIFRSGMSMLTSLSILRPSKETDRFRTLM